MRRRHPALVLTITSVLLLLGACGGGGEPSATTTEDGATPSEVASTVESAPEPASPAESEPADGPSDEPSSEPASPPTAAALSEPPPTEDLGQLSDQPQVVERSPASTPTLVDVRTGHHATYDRVVFEFEGPLPGYRVEYVGEVTQPGSGNRVELDGNDFLDVLFEPAVAHDEDGQPTYTGPREIDTGYPSLREVELAGDFEAQVEFGIGLDDRVGFRVFELTNPSRIVIDVAG